MYFPEIEDYKTGVLLDKPFTFEVRRLGDSFLNIASFSPKDSLNRDWFFGLLRMAKPGGKYRTTGQSIEGITADWEIILPQVREKEKRSRDLYEYHIKYVPGFPEFEVNHFEKFWNNMVLSKEEEVLLDRQARRLISKEIDWIRSIGNKEVEVRKGKSYLKVGFERDNDSGYLEIVEKEKNISHYIAPTVMWKTDEDGKKSFFCGKIPQAWIQAFPNLFSERHDTLAGQLLVSAYSPKQRDKMPKEYPIIDENGEVKTQQMLEAQGVILVKMPKSQERFLTYSSVILGLEEMAKKG